MKNFLKQLTIQDFMPPIINRVSNKIRRKLNNTPGHPFDCIPKNVSPLWFLDVGANIGDVTTAALTSYPACNAICFEPVSKTFDHLKNRLSVFSERCTLFNMALSDKAGEGEINITTFHGANSILPQSRLHKQSSGVVELEKQKIKLVKLDDICADFPSKKIDIMKIDVEGFELNVLMGGQQFIRENVDVIIVEISPYRNDYIGNNYVENVFLFMKGAGFSLINIFDVNHIDNHPNLILGHMDCVFRRNSNL